MDEQKKKLAALNEREAENMAVEQFTKLYNEIDEKELDISKLELDLINTFYAGMYYKEAVMDEEKERTKSYVNSVEEMRDAANDIYDDSEYWDEFFDKISELTSNFNS